MITFRDFLLGEVKNENVELTTTTDQKEIIISDETNYVEIEPEQSLRLVMHDGTT